MKTHEHGVKLDAFGAQALLCCARTVLALPVRTGVRVFVLGSTSVQMDIMAVVLNVKVHQTLSFLANVGPLVMKYGCSRKEDTL